MFSKLTLLFLAASIASINGGLISVGTGRNSNIGTCDKSGTNCTTTQEISTQHNNAQQFLSTGGQKIGALAARFGSFALFWNSTKEAALIDLIHGFAAFKDQADAQAATLKTNIKDAENKAKTATGDQRAKLNCGVTILKKDLASVNEANDKVLNDTRVQAPFEKAQEDIRHLFDNFSTTNCPTFDNKVTELVTRMKSVSDEGVVYGLKRADELKVQIEAQKLREGCDLVTLSDLQNQYKDRILHVLSFLAPEKTYIDNAITKANDLIQTVDKSKKMCLTSSINKLEKLSGQLTRQINNVYPRLLKL